MTDSYSITMEVLPRALEIQEMTVELDGSTTVSELYEFALDQYPQIPNKNPLSYTLYSQVRRANYDLQKTISQILGNVRSDRFTINTSANVQQPGGLLQTNPLLQSGQQRNNNQGPQIQQPLQYQPNNIQSSSQFYQNPNLSQMIIYYQYYNISGQVSLPSTASLGDLYIAIQNNLRKQPIEIFLYQQNLKQQQKSLQLQQIGIQNGVQVIVQDGQQVPGSNIIQNQQNQANFAKEITLQFQVIDGSRQTQYKCKFKGQQQLFEVAKAVQSYLGIDTDSAAIDIYMFGQIYNKKMDKTLEQLCLKDGQQIEARVRWIGGNVMV